ncbi:hypothetical protein DPMN_012801 [Dreissena polymorpha]|uniref:Uncharacterized protein n=1 Tax=Dreissena polymorpha TaxID=45954 RepID=A0A9D4N6I6_DREPO|nr:hypothetical protein DPMN_012801 [Dreissena polymorpha]
MKRHLSCYTKPPGGLRETCYIKNLSDGHQSCYTKPSDGHQSCHTKPSDSHQSCYTKLKMAKETLVMLHQTFFLMDSSLAIPNLLMARETPVFVISDLLMARETSVLLYQLF